MKFTADFKFKIAFLSFLFIFSSSSVFASFDPLAVGGRAAGMGEAYGAIADDIYAVYYNPAGVLQLERPEIGTYYSKLFSGLTDSSQLSRTFVGYGQTVKKGSKQKGSFGVSYLALDLSGLYKEETLALTYGREYRRRWNLGTSVKMLRKQIGSDGYATNAIDPISGASASGVVDPVLTGARSASALSLDLGLQYRLTRAYALGFAARNINSPDVALGNQKDKAPAVFNLALARRLRNGSLDIEMMNWKAGEQNTRFSLGGEVWMKNGFGIRAGGGVGSRNYSSLSFGASYRMESIQLDYAAVIPLQGVQGTIGNQQISLTIRLGKPPVDPIENQLVREKEQRVKAETEARLAIGERDHLKRQLLELTQAKTKEKQQEEEDSAQKALEEAQIQAQKQNQATQQETTPAADAKIFAEYTAALADYNNKVQQGIGLAEKEQILEKIQAQFGNTKVNLSTVRRELKSIKVEEARAKKDFELSMSFYQRLVQQGASNDEMKNMLQRIIQKYQGSNIDISMAEEEMKKLK